MLETHPGLASDRIFRVIRSDGSLSKSVYFKLCTVQLIFFEFVGCATANAFGTYQLAERYTN